MDASQRQADAPNLLCLATLMAEGHAHPLIGLQWHWLRIQIPWHNTESIHREQIKHQLSKSFSTSTTTMASKAGKGVTSAKSLFVIQYGITDKSRYWSCRNALARGFARLFRRYLHNAVQACLIREVQTSPKSSPTTLCAEMSACTSDQHVWASVPGNSLTPLTPQIWWVSSRPNQSLPPSP